MRAFVLPLLVAACALGAALPLHAQGAEWTPPSRMPAMPSAAELTGNWQPVPWLQGITRVSGQDAGAARTLGETPPGRDRCNFVRLLSGHVPMATLSDRNGDGTADLVEIFREGSRAVQVIDADYDGRANVVRTYAPSGELLRERRL